MRMITAPAGHKLTASAGLATTPRGGTIVSRDASVMVLHRPGAPRDAEGTLLADGGVYARMIRQQADPYRI
jgi:hypothetical protein